jgi:hypothetical protein
LLRCSFIGSHAIVNDAVNRGVNHDQFALFVLQRAAVYHRENWDKEAAATRATGIRLAGNA